MKLNKKFVVTSIAGTLALAGAVITTGVVSAQTSDTKADTVFTRVAQILGIDNSKLTNAVKQAETEKVEAKLKEGKITQDQADKIKADIANGNLRMGMGEGMRGGKGFGEMGMNGMDDLSTFLGISESELRSALKNSTSTTITDLIKSKGKSIDEAKNYLYQKASDNLKQKVTDGKLTQAESDNILAKTKTRIDDFLSGKMPTRPAHIREKNMMENQNSPEAN